MQESTTSTVGNDAGGTNEAMDALARLLAKPGERLLLIDPNNAASQQEGHPTWVKTVAEARACVASASHPASTYAIRLADGVVAVDCDQDGEPGYALLESLQLWCSHESIPHLVVASGREGHGWIIAVATGIHLELLRDRVSGIPHATLREKNAILRPPGAPHRFLKRVARLVEPVSASEAMERLRVHIRSAGNPRESTPKGAARAPRISDRKATRTETNNSVPPPHPRIFRFPGDLDPDYRQLAVRGSGPKAVFKSDGSLDRSKALYSLALHACWRGWTEEEFVFLSANRRNRGCEKAWDRLDDYAGGVYRRARARVDAARNCLPRRMYGLPVLNVAMIRSVVWNWAWTSKSRRYVLAVTEALLLLAARAGSLINFPASMRDIALAAGIHDWQAVARHVHTLRERGLLVQKQKYRVGDVRANRYDFDLSLILQEFVRLPLPARILDGSPDDRVGHDIFTEPTRPPRPGARAATRPIAKAKGGLGKGHWLVYQALGHDPSSVQSIVMRSWIPCGESASRSNQRSVQRILETLTSLGLATLSADGWSRGPQALDAAAASHGATGMRQYLCDVFEESRRRFAVVRKYGPRPQDADVPGPGEMDESEPGHEDLMWHDEQVDGRRYGASSNDWPSAEEHSAAA